MNIGYFFCCINRNKNEAVENNQTTKQKILSHYREYYSGRRSRREEAPPTQSAAARPFQHDRFLPPADVTVRIDYYTPRSPPVLRTCAPPPALTQRAPGAVPRKAAPAPHRPHETKLCHRARPLTAQGGPSRNKTLSPILYRRFLHRDVPPSGRSFSTRPIPSTDRHAEIT